MARFSKWFSLLLDQSVDDDLTPELDLVNDYEFVTVLIPTIDSSTVTVHVSNEKGGTFYPVHALDDDATGSFASATTAAVTSIAVTFRIGGAQYIKVAFGSGQSADVNLLVKGFNRS